LLPPGHDLAGLGACHDGIPDGVTDRLERRVNGTSGGRYQPDHLIALAARCDRDTDLPVNQTDTLATVTIANPASVRGCKAAWPAVNLSRHAHDLSHATLTHSRAADFAFVSAPGLPPI